MFSIFKSKSNLTKSEFAKQFFSELNKKVKELELVSIDELTVITKLKDSNNYQHFLNNCFSEYVREPKDLKNILERYTLSAKDLFQPEETVQIDRVIPIIKDKKYLIESSKIIDNFEDNHIYETYNSELYVFYAEDKEHTVSYLTKDKFELLRIDLDILKNKAIENLNQIVSNMERHGENGYFMLTSGGNYESSLLLLDIWNKENFPVNGEIFIGIPARDVILITGSKDYQNIAKLKETVKEINESGDHIISDKIFEFKNGLFEKTE